MHVKANTDLVRVSVLMVCYSEIKCVLQCSCHQNVP